jgi:SAM-dependent methyltransferase
MTVNSPELYVCPSCKGPLQAQAAALRCPACEREYPIANDIPDFLLVRPEQSPNPILRDITKVGSWARLYETALWYPVVLAMYGGWGALTFKEIIAYVRKNILPVQGLVLDVATGTATYGRRVASAGRAVYGIDISLDMMAVGQDYVRREGVTDMRFARADVEALPFPGGVFDGCITSGSLHLFPDTLKALTEIGRTMKSGAPLVVLTFTREWKTGIMKHEWVRRHVLARGRIRFFEVSALREFLDRAGFERFEPEPRGGVLLFTARKR